MTVWIMVLMLSGSGKAMVVLPFEYSSQEACIQAALDAGRELPSYVCISGPSVKS